MKRLLSLLVPAALLTGLVYPGHSTRVTHAAEPAVQPKDAARAKLQYNRDIRPILAENCFACHGPDSAARKADLRLDRHDDAVGAGAIVPGKPDKSEAITRLFAEPGEGLMPPAKSHKKLTAAQKETLKRWVVEGAEYEPHWSFLTPKRPTLPSVKDKSWVKNPIDTFVLAKLEAAGLKPAPEADRRTLARRLAFDLTGLPPEPADVEAFVADKSSNWYEKYVEKLLASQQWGEHRGRHWLDYARYADTHGIHFDNYREVWSYRDWVINAFNTNQPFDQFTIEQLAGDLLPEPTIDQRVATGFSRCNITTNEGGAIKDEYYVLYARDRTETAASVWLGLTAGCAVCHDHKYDPLSMRDFYSLSAFFNNTTQDAMDGNIHNTPPTINVPRPEDRPRYEQVLKSIRFAKDKLDGRKEAARPEFEKWLANAKPEDLAAKNPTQGLAFHAPLKEGKGDAIAFSLNGKGNKVKLPGGHDFSGNRPDKSKGAFVIKAGDSLAFKDVGDFDRTQPFAVSMWVAISKRGNNGAIVARMDEGNGYRGWDVWIQADRIGTHLINAYPQDALKVVAKAQLQPNKWTHVTVAFDGSGKASGTKIYYDGEPQPVDVEQDSLKSTTRTSVPFKIGQRSGGQRTVGVAIEDLRVYDRQFTAIDAQQVSGSKRTADIVSKPPAKRTKQEVDELFTWWLVSQDKAYRDLAAEYRAVQAEEVAIKGRGTIAHVMNEKSGEATAYILFRGEYDQKRDLVKAGTPASMPPMAKDLPRNRLGLARWLLTAEHPLTTRVTVNRFWQEVFGTGLVKTSGDFGIAGELPSHPELLDWLAVEFREPTPGLLEGGAWDVKRIFKLIVTSNTYRQSAVATAEKLEKDRDNRLLSRGPRFRMDAEMIRDNALAASGLLVRKIGGPSVKPYQPDGVWEAVAMIGSNTRNYKRDAGENLYRRSMYTFWKRAAPPASMEVLNAPNRETCAVRRDRTNTPIAALLTLNDVQFVEAARVLAEKAIKGAKDDEGRIAYISARLISRPFKPQELAIVKDSLAALRATYQEKPEEAKKLIAFGESKADPTLDASELATWTMLVNELFNLDEVLNK